jgi:hypothetical protein
VGGRRCRFCRCWWPCHLHLVLGLGWRCRLRSQALLLKSGQQSVRSVEAEFVLRSVRWRLLRWARLRRLSKQFVALEMGQQKRRLQLFVEQMKGRRVPRWLQFVRPWEEPWTRQMPQSLEQNPARPRRPRLRSRQQHWALVQRRRPRYRGQRKVVPKQAGERYLPHSLRQSELHPRSKLFVLGRGWCWKPTRPGVQRESRSSQQTLAGSSPTAGS